jgi:hypothetical protein
MAQPLISDIDEIGDINDLPEEPHPSAKGGWERDALAARTVVAGAAGERFLRSRGAVIVPRWVSAEGLRVTALHIAATKPHRAITMSAMVSS